MKSFYSLLACSISYSDLKPSIFVVGSKLYLKLCRHTHPWPFSPQVQIWGQFFKRNGFHLFGIRLNIFWECVRVGCVKAWLLYACQSLSSPLSQICCYPFLSAFLLMYMQKEKVRERNTVKWWSQRVWGGKGKVSGGICIWGWMRSCELLLIWPWLGSWVFWVICSPRGRLILYVWEREVSHVNFSPRDTDIHLRIPSQMR